MAEAKRLLGLYQLSLIIKRSGEIRQLNLDLTKLASINASILIENKKLTAINSSKNVVVMEK